MTATEKLPAAERVEILSGRLRNLRLQERRVKVHGGGWWGSGLIRSINGCQAALELARKELADGE